MSQTDPDNSPMLPDIERLQEGIRLIYYDLAIIDEMAPSLQRYIWAVADGVALLL